MGGSQSRSRVNGESNRIESPYPVHSLTVLTELFLLQMRHFRNSVNAIWDTSFGIATGYGLDGRGSIPESGKKFFSTPQRPERHSGPPNPISNGYQVFSPRE
jgi:hypothetical protein